MTKPYGYGCLVLAALVGCTATVEDAPDGTSTQEALRVRSLTAVRHDAEGDEAYLLEALYNTPEQKAAAQQLLADLEVVPSDSLPPAEVYSEQAWESLAASPAPGLAVIVYPMREEEIDKSFGFRIAYSVDEPPAGESLPEQPTQPTTAVQHEGSVVGLTTSALRLTPGKMAGYDLFCGANYESRYRIRRGSAAVSIIGPIVLAALPTTRYRWYTHRFSLPGFWLTSVANVGTINLYYDVSVRCF